MAATAAVPIVVLSTKNRGWMWAKLALLPVALLVTIIAGVAQGPDSIPFSSVISIVLSHVGLPVAHALPAWQADIIWNIRLPEVLAAVLVGSALAVAGAVFQGILRNPLADPFVIGTSSGAAFGVSVAFWLWAPSLATISSFVWLGFGLPQVFAFFGAMAAVGAVILMAMFTRAAGSMTILLAGFAVSTLALAGMWFSAYEGGHVGLLLGWMMGSLGASSWSQLTLIGPLLIGCEVATLLFMRDLNALLLGEDQAGHVGVDPVRSRLILILLAAVMTSLAVSVAGIIGFVGLVIPHIARLVYGANHRFLLVTSAALGAIFLVLCDLLARTAEPSGGELPLGILTAIVGAPVFLFLLMRRGAAYSF